MHGEEHRELCCYSAVHSELLLKASQQNWNSSSQYRNFHWHVGILKPVCLPTSASWHVLSTSESAFSFTCTIIQQTHQSKHVSNTGDLFLLQVSRAKLTGLQDWAQAFSVFVQHCHLVEASLDSREVTALLQCLSCSAKKLVWTGKSCHPPVTKNELASSTYKLLRYQTGIPCCSFFFIFILPHTPTLKRVLEINVFTSALTGRLFRATAGGQWFSIVKCK